MPNVDRKVVDGFGKEWSKFDQRDADTAELESVFQSYFAIFPWAGLASSSRGIRSWLWHRKMGLFCRAARETAALHRS